MSKRFGVRYSDQIKEFIENNPDVVVLNWSGIATRMGLSDYRPIKRFFRSNKEFIENIKKGIVTKRWEDTNYGKGDKPSIKGGDLKNVSVESKTKDIEFEGVTESGLDIASFESYCKIHGIPIEQATSAKFINHNGQRAWNVFCDLTKVSEVHLNNYFDKLKDELIRSIEPIEIEQDLNITEDKAYIFWFADKHVGAHTNDKAMFGNRYSIDIFKERMMASLEDFQIALDDFGTFDKVVIADLGDALDGWDKSTTRKASTHVLPQNANNRESFDAYARVMCEFMETLIQMNGANSYKFISVTNDNHSSDFGYICNRAVEIWLNVKYPEVETRITEKFIEHFHYGEHTFMITHGKDSEHMRYGMPLNLDQKTEMFINTYIDEFRLDGFLHLVKGDLHQASTNYSRKFRYRNVWSVYGSSDWSQTNFGVNPAGVSTEIVYKNINKVYQDECFFTKTFHEPLEGKFFI